MKIQDNIGKIAWSFADKMTYVIYGFVTLLQMRAMDPADYGLFAMLIGLHTWIFVVTDSFALAGIVQFGTFEENRKKVNLFSLILHLSITLGGAACVFLFKETLANLFKEQQFIKVGYALPILTILTIPRTFAIKIIFRERAFSKLFWVNFTFFGTMSVVSLYFILLKHTLYFEDMITIYYIGTSISAAFAVITTFRHLRFGWHGNIKFKQMINFSVPIALYSILHALPRNLDTYFIKFFFPLSTVGVYNSAKTLYRLFEEANNATFGILYPVAVRQYEFKNYKNLNDLMTKALSFLFVTILILVIILESGFSKFLITSFLPIKYHLAITQFNLLMIAALFLPFTVITSIITAYGKPQKVLLFVLISLILSLVSFYIIGIIGSPMLTPLGLIIYTLTLGLFCYFYIRKNMEFRLPMLFRIFSDSANFIKNSLKK